MDAQAVENTIWLRICGIAVTVLSAILGAVLYDYNARFKALESEAVRKDEIKDIVRAVIAEMLEHRHE